MKTVTIKGKIENAYGKPVSYYLKGVDSLEFSGDYEEYTDAAEVRSRGEWPNDKTIVDFLNAQEKASARAKYTTETLTKNGINKPEADDPKVVHAGMVKQLMLGKKSRDAAVALATQALGWDSDGNPVA